MKISPFQHVYLCSRVVHQIVIWIFSVGFNINQNPLDEGSRKGETIVSGFLLLALRCNIWKFGCVGLQLKVAGKSHLKINTCKKSIVQKYRKGKMQQTFKSDLKIEWKQWIVQSYHLSCLHGGIVIGCKLLWDVFLLYSLRSGSHSVVFRSFQWRRK